LSVTFAADNSRFKLFGVDVVSAATTDTSTTTPAQPTKPTTPAKTNIPSKQTVEVPSVDIYPSIFDPSKYKDGSYSAIGSASVYGAERADIIIKNGKLVDVLLYKLEPNLSIAGANYDWQKALQAIPPLTYKFMSKGFYIENVKVDAISGATNSINSWNLAMKRAFAKASKEQPKNQYFNGTFIGVDANSRVLVCADIKGDNVVKVTTYLFGPHNKILADYELTPAQKDIIAKLNTDLLQNNVKASNIKGAESICAAARSAYSNMLSNASRK
jgi:uncharacterized protein with FMN-binding domain